MLHTKTLSELSTGLRKKEFSSIEITQAFLDRIAQFDKQLNCFITCEPEQALSQAKRADKILACGNANPLTGIPVAHKDIFCTQGIGGYNGMV